MRITVAICTHNRASQLGRSLARWTAVTLPAEPVSLELLVVANACNDETASVIRSFESRLPLTLAEESCLGLSHARNRAAAVATGQYIAWLDDDCLIEPGYLRAYEEAFRSRPEAWFFGGPICADFEGNVPVWLDEILPVVGPVFGCRELGSVPRKLDARTLPFGGNFAVRADIQRRYRYDPAFGRRGELGSLGEETRLLLEMLTDGGCGWWVPEARVRHFVPLARQNWACIERHWNAQGACLADLMSDSRFTHIVGRPRDSRGFVVRAFLYFLRARVFASRTEWTRALARLKVVLAADRALRAK